MDNNLVRWQMRKMGYDMHNKKDGIAFADEQYHFLEWLQSLYDSGCLDGGFYTDNIVKEMWNRFRLSCSDPLLALKDFNCYLYKELSIAVTGDPNRNHEH